MTVELFNFLNHFSLASHVCGCPEVGKETGACLSPSPPLPLPPPGACACNGNSGRVGSYSVFHILKVQHCSHVKNSQKSISNEIESHFQSL